jgi:DNA-binding response OmpR family regulator
MLRRLEAYLNSTVAIVDLNPFVVAPLAAALTDAGYDSSGEYSYEAARHRLESSPPDVLVVSVELGTHNGLQLAMRASVSVPATRVIVIGPASAALEHDACELGASAYMQRPLDARDLVDQIKAFGSAGRRPRARAKTVHAIARLHNTA